MIQLAKLIDDHLVLSRKSQKDFAAEIGVPKGALSRFLNGKAISQDHVLTLVHWTLDTIERPAGAARGGRDRAVNYLEALQQARR